MKIKASRLIRQLQKLVGEHGDLDLIYSKDDEGNEFHPVSYDAQAGNYDGLMFTPAEEGTEPDVICIN